jgi:hypothetical protein
MDLIRGHAGKFLAVVLAAFLILRHNQAMQHGTLDGSPGFYVVLWLFLAVTCYSWGCLFDELRRRTRSGFASSHYRKLGGGTGRALEPFVYFSASLALSVLLLSMAFLVWSRSIGTGLKP